tara:strand:- start:755 stop:904 length:150 start_codon:yes stop_codon:yes gene_type:complete
MSPVRKIPNVKVKNIFVEVKFFKSRNLDTVPTPIMDNSKVIENIKVWKY